jgi:hypothetical protein
MPSSDDSELHSAQPLLSNFDSSIYLKQKPRDESVVSFRSLEDGSSKISSDSDSDIEFEDLRRRQGFWRRLRMALRRRHGRGGLGSGSVKKDDGERRGPRWRCSRKMCLGLSVLVMCVL